MRHGIQFPPPASCRLLAEWLRYAQVLSIVNDKQVRVWVPKNTPDARQIRPGLWAVEFQLDDTLRDKLYQLGVISPLWITLWCPKGIGRPKSWQQANIGRLASYNVTAIAVRGEVV